jgi:Asp-tRNA(Asn)/Glu-tRNA(Gln) amidotransferase B subunit
VPFRLPTVDLRALCQDIVRDFPEEATKVRGASGAAPVLNKLIGAVMRRCRGAADARATRQMLISVIMASDGKGEA